MTAGSKLFVFMLFMFKIDKTLGFASPDFGPAENAWLSIFLAIGLRCYCSFLEFLLSTLRLTLGGC